MPIEVLVPPLGQTVDVVKLVSWYKSEGDTVQQGEPLFVIETDKATLDVEAPADGTLRCVTAAPGDDVKALSAIALIAAPGEEVKVEVQARVKAKAEAQPILHPTSTSTLASVSASRRFVSPRGVPVGRGRRSAAGSHPTHRPRGRDHRAGRACLSW